MTETPKHNRTFCAVAQRENESDPEKYDVNQRNYSSKL